MSAELNEEGNMTAQIITSGYESEEENPIRREIQNGIQNNNGEDMILLNPYICDDGLLDFLIAASELWGSQITILCAECAKRLKKLLKDLQIKIILRQFMINMQVLILGYCGSQLLRTNID